MPEVKLVRGPIKPGKADELRAWYAELEERESEVRETLQHEGVYTETAFIHSLDDGAYLYVYMEAEDFEAAHEAGAEEEYEIDEEHHEVLRETLDGDAPWEELETIGHMTNPALR